MKAKILKAYEENSSVNELFEIFDEAYDDVQKMVQNGAWKEFRMKARFNTSKLSPAVLDASNPKSSSHA